MRATEQQVERFERAASRVLGVGLTTSASFLVTGFLVELVANHGLGIWFLRAGLLVLMATPAARVCAALVEYLLVRDWFFVASTTAIALVLVGAVLSAYGLMP